LNDAVIVRFKDQGHWDIQRSRSFCCAKLRNESFKEIKFGEIIIQGNHNGR